MSEGGVWYRHGHTIVILPAASLRTSEWGGESEFEVGPSYTVCDFIDPHIDVAAQRALYRLVKSDPASRADALAMLAAVKARRLEGIYQEDQKVPALRAQKLGKGWWQMIPQGVQGICVTQPSTALPLIAFKKALAKDIAALAQTLRSAWSQCGLPRMAPPPPSGRPCSAPPSPPPPPPPPPPQNGKPKPKPTGCDIEEGIDFDEKFERHFQGCCSSLSAAKMFCEFAPEWAKLLPEFEICRLTPAQFDERVDRCIFQAVHAEVVQETGIVASLGDCSPAAITSRRFAEWKRRTGRRCS